MIMYRYDEEKVVALFFADDLGDSLARRIIERGEVQNKQKAIHLSQFFWAMVNKSSEAGVDLPCEGDSEYWAEQLYNSFGGYLEKAGYENEWNEQIDKA